VLEKFPPIVKVLEEIERTPAVIVTSFVEIFPAKVFVPVPSISKL
tara:strand:- start:208 stop:342 length:135 start_codon:yes stop_codon:yes gene_type:complete